MKKTLNILIITNSIFSMEDHHVNRIMETVPEANLMIANKRTLTEDMLQQAEIIFGWPEEDDLRKAENLKWLQLPSAGADSYMDKDNYHHKDLILTNSSGVFGLPIAEHVFSMILAYNHNLADYLGQQKSKQWKGIGKTRDFYGSTLGVIGLGDIGKEVAKRAKAWGARVLAVKRTLSQVPDYVDQLYTMEEMDYVLEQSDYIVLALPNTQKTNGIITEERLKRMKPHTFLVNIGRGSLVDQEALIKALQEGWIGGAGLDVMTPEPLPQENLLWEQPNVIITPHVSGFSPSNEERRVGIFLRNLSNYLKQEPMENVVSFEEGY